MSALNLNKIMMCGRLTADVELKATQSGRNVCSFTLAVNQPKQKDSVEQKADFFNCVAWDKTAEFITRYFSKGNSLFIIGKLRNRSYKDREGRTVYVTEVYIDEASFVDSKASNAPDALAELDALEVDESLPF